jgi:hypothetical protein
MGEDLLDQLNRYTRNILVTLRFNRLDIIQAKFTKTALIGMGDKRGQPRQTGIQSSRRQTSIDQLTPISQYSSEKSFGLGHQAPEPRKLRFLLAITASHLHEFLLDKENLSLLRHQHPALEIDHPKVAVSE